MSRYGVQGVHNLNKKMSEQTSAVPKGKSISSLYIDLIRFEQKEEYDRAIKTCNKILNQAPNEASALNCKIISYMHLLKFEEALQLIQKNVELTRCEKKAYVVFVSKFQNHFQMYFEKSYCQYRLNQPEKALETVNSAPVLDHHLSELKAQILYRLEKYEDCYTLYRDVFKNISDEYNEERLANLNAIISNIKNVPMPDVPQPTYEILFNVAYHLIQNEKYTEAEKKLKQCEKLCRETLEDDGCTEDEIEHDMSIVKIQLAYVYQKQGRLKEAQMILTQFIKRKSDDAALVAVACNNAVTLNKGQKIFDSKKKMKHTMQESLEHKLNDYQRKNIALNNCLLAYDLNQPEQCRKLGDNCVAKWPETAIVVNVIKALLWTKEDNYNKAIEILSKLPIHSMEENLYIKLTIVHLLLYQGDKKKACEVLYNLCEQKFYPGIVGALVTLHIAQGDEVRAAKVFEDAVAWYHKHKVSKGDLGHMWMQAAEFHMRSGHPVVAAKSLEELLKTNVNDTRTIALLIMAYMQFDFQHAKAYSSQLPSFSELTKDLNEDEVDTWSMYGIKGKPSRSELSPSTPRAEVIVKKKRSKCRKGKLPQNYKIGEKPDPERWLPKYDRAGFKKKRDRRTKDIIKGSQGSSSVSAEIYDYSKNVEKLNEELDSPEQVSKSSNNVAKRPQQKKKRKTKW